MLEWYRLYFNQALETLFADPKWETTSENKVIQDKILEGKTIFLTHHQNKCLSLSGLYIFLKQDMKDKVGLNITFEEFEY